MKVKMQQDTHLINYTIKYIIFRISILKPVNTFLSIPTLQLMMIRIKFFIHIIYPKYKENINKVYSVCAEKKDLQLDLTTEKTVKTVIEAINTLILKVTHKIEFI